MDWLDRELKALRERAKLESNMDLQAVRVDMNQGKMIMRKICRGK